MFLFRVFVAECCERLSQTVYPTFRLLYQRASPGLPLGSPSTESPLVHQPIPPRGENASPTRQGRSSGLGFSWQPRSSGRLSRHHAVRRSRRLEVQIDPGRSFSPQEVLTVAIVCGVDALVGAGSADGGRVCMRVRMLRPWDRSC